MQDISKIGKRSSTTNSFSNSISGSFSKSNSTATNSISITSKLTNFKQENERKLIDRYPFLDDPKQLRTYYGSFDNHPNEYYMVDFWKDLLEFMYESSFNCFAAKLEEIYDLTKIKGKKPIGLPNIIKKFNADNIFVFQKDLLSDEYFQKYHPDVIPKASMIGSIVGSIGSNLYSYFSSYIYKPTDIEPNLEDILINIKLFKLYCNEILEHIELISRETDSQVITLISLLNNISYLTEKNVEICLQYMHKLKKLIYFTTKIDSRDIKCIKYLNGNYEDAKIEDKDTVILNLQHSIDKLDRKENEIHEVMEDLTIKIKENLIKNQRDKAKNILKKKKLYEAKYNEYCNMKLTLEKNLLDIKSNEGNQMTKISLQESIKTIKELQLQNKEFDQVFDIMRNNREDLQDITNTVKDFNNEEINDEEMDDELLKLQNLMLSDNNTNSNNSSISNLEKEKMVEFPVITKTNKVLSSNSNQQTMDNKENKNLSKSNSNNSNGIYNLINKVLEDDNLDILLKELNKDLN